MWQAPGSGQSLIWRLQRGARSEKEVAPPADNASYVHWRRVLDSLVMEALSTVMVNVSAIVYANHGFTAQASDGGAYYADPWLQLVPALATGLVMITCKTNELLPPDAALTVTVLMWAAGAYKSWLEVVARLLGHAVGFGTTLLLCKDMALAPQWLPHARPPGLSFASELVATAIEHVALACLLLPILHIRAAGSSSSNGSSVNNTNAKSPNTPTTAAILHAATVFAVSHWVLRVTFLAEMNPSVTLAKATLSDWQLRGGGVGHTLDEVWNDCLMAVWGQFVGLGLSIIYAVVLCRHVASNC